MRAGNADRREKDALQIPSLYLFAQLHSTANKNGLGKLENHGEESLKPRETSNPLPHGISPIPLLLPPSNPGFSHLLPG